ncbi:MAG: hypothetical protein IRZ00_00355 [Gemmatimonadetes bacterium]|nr:hypothetical protein [Gemmatimonadota bacterium]
MTRRWLAALLLVALAAAPAIAHEHGRIYLGASQAAPGDSLALRGEKLSKATTFRVVLRGPLASYPLGEVTTDRAGAFQSTLRLPAEARAGAYTVVLLAPDGDVSARADLALTAAEPPAGAPAAGAPAAVAAEHAAHAPAVAAPHATAQPMALPVHAGPGEWAVIALVTLACLGAGARLLRPARR